ncbi:hypothetical protein DSW25_11575 [Sulfitobacter donghicola DSW-25 = KCTC 12864 = JCM 14565]|uniref:Uncharacterized protein n=1 Tax=Sulfitobacter donghicola DSW-25 = KCTC 12864 = JCM 14565 TaxID=1300350 RepID=A0A073IH66_9RHOB|nr:hypothetical protein DSW25_11575 [Sulfitobacter donghicola DSW-25 = KCTC 12864 = JCM 14565]
MPVTWKIIGTAVASFAVAWLLFVSFYRPTDHEYLITTTSYYFKRMSEIGHTGSASFSDCRLEQADASERDLGISMFGLCRSETDVETFHFSIAMSATAKFVFSDMEQRSANE